MNNELLDELLYADIIIKNALSLMSFQQKNEWAKLNEKTLPVLLDGTTRAHEREAVITRASLNKH